MRSTVFTLFLAVAALLSCGLAGWALTRGNLDKFLGTPPAQVGERLYDDFKAEQVNHIRVAANGVKVNFYKTDAGWVATEPWKDRVDHRAAISIIQFTLSMRVEDRAPTDDIKLRNVGLRDGSIQILLEDGQGAQLAKYALGMQTPWQATVEGQDQAVPTVFIRPRDDNHQDYVYGCTGDINPLFKDGLKFLRDHHPLYFNPLAIQKIRIRTEQGELTLGHETSKNAWRIIKPLDLPTSSTAIKSLLDGLFRLQAVKVTDRAESPLPAAGTTKPIQIAFQNFGSDKESIMEIYPAGSADARTVMATVNDRPNTVFHLPLKPEADLVSLADLPLAVNDLRDRKLTNLNRQSLRAISIRPSTGPEVLISRTPPREWMATINGRTEPANEERLYALLKTVTEGKVVDFETDAASDFSPWGLDKPFLKLVFLGADNQTLELDFGLDGRGGIFVNRQGSPSVMQVDKELLAGISVRPYEWKHARLWSVSRVDLIALERQAGTRPPLLLKYDFIGEKWSGTVPEGESVPTTEDNLEFKGMEKDVSEIVDQAHANYMLTALEGLKVFRWLSQDDAAAATALATPALRLAVTEKTVNEMGDFQGLLRREIQLSPTTAEADPAYYYGKLNTEPHYFLLDRETYRRISLNLLEKN